MDNFIKIFYGLLFIGSGCYCFYYTFEPKIGYLMAGFGVLSFICGGLFISLNFTKFDNWFDIFFRNKINSCGGYIIASLLCAFFSYICPSILDKILFLIISIGCAVNFFSKLYEKFIILKSIASIFNSFFIGIAGYFLFKKYWFADAPMLSKIFFISLICAIQISALIFLVLSLVKFYYNVKEYLTRACSKRSS